MTTTQSPHAPHTRLGAPRSRSSRIAWILWGLSVALLLGTLPLLIAVQVATSQTPTVLPFQLAQQFHLSVRGWFTVAITPVTILAFSTLGAVIVTRHPENRIGWLFCAIGLLEIVEPFAAYYAVYTLWVQPGSLPGGLAAAWLQNWIWVVSSGLLVVFLPFVFPTGRLLSRHWRPVGWFSACVVALQAFVGAFHPGPLWNYFDTGQVNNPLGIEALGDLFTTIGNLPFGLLLAAMLVSATSLLLRWRRARGEERLQIKWFASVGAILAGLFVVQGLVRYILTISTPTDQTSIFELLFPFAWNVAFAALPLATGLAILKYRLYDIDVLINRTLVYGTLTVILTGVYVGLVIGLQALLRGLISQDNSVAIVLSTLAIAALFQPLRQRIQRIIDRRFYRRKYDAAKTVVAFSTTLRQEVDLEQLREHLLAVVQETMQPAHVSLWLRPPAPDSKRQGIWNSTSAARLPPSEKS